MLCHACICLLLRDVLRKMLQRLLVALFMLPSVPCSTKRKLLAPEIHQYCSSEYLVILDDNTRKYLTSEKLSMFNSINPPAVKRGGVKLRRNANTYNACVFGCALYHNASYLQISLRFFKLLFSANIRWNEIQIKQTVSSMVIIFSFNFLEKMKRKLDWKLDNLIFFLRMIIRYKIKSNWNDCELMRN